MLKLQFGPNRGMKQNICRKVVGGLILGGFLLPFSACGQEAEHEVLEQFLNGEVSAYDATLDRRISVEDLYPGDEFSEYDDNRMWADFDNDGRDELWIGGIYGGIILDERAGEAYVLAAGEGTAGVLFAREFDGKTWIVHADATHSGREIYDFDCYDGSGEIVETRNLSKEYWETPDTPDGPGTVYSYNGEVITRAEYEELALLIN